MNSRGISYCCCVIIKNDTKTNMPKQTLNTQQIIVCTIIILFWILVLNYGKLALGYQITYCLEDISLIWSEIPGKEVLGLGSKIKFVPLSCSLLCILGVIETILAWFFFAQLCRA